MHALSTRLSEGGVADPSREARLLVAYVLSVEPSRVGLEAAREVSEREAAKLAEVTAERLAGRTVGRIVGCRAFHEIELGVSDHVLEPRDDTGALVDLALPFLRARCDERDTATVWDIGCGAGTVALALLVLEPRAVGLATDVNDHALALTGRNAERLGVRDRLRLEDRSGLEGGDMERFDLIVSNPPYIRSGEIDGLPREVRRDPRNALDGGADGLLFYRMFAAGGADRLAPNGRLAVEIGAGQGGDVRSIFGEQGWHEAGAMIDLGGHERALAFVPGARR